MSDLSTRHNLTQASSAHRSSWSRSTPRVWAALCVAGQYRLARADAARLSMTATFHPSIRITSRNHPALRRIRSLHDRNHRFQTGLFPIEGVRFLHQALEHRAKFEELVVAPDLLRSPVGQKLVRRLVRDGVRCYEVPAEVLHGLCSTDDPQGVLAVVRQDWVSIERADPAGGLCWIALSGVQSAGNLGSLIRTADAVSAAGFFLVGETADPYDPACVRATMGAVFALPFVRTNLRGLIEWKHRHRALLVGTSPAGEVSYRDVPYRTPTVLFLGSERKGLAEPELAACDVLARIPMVGRSDSLNVAVAAGVLLYEVLAQLEAQPALRTG